MALVAILCLLTLTQETLRPVCSDPFGGTNRILYHCTEHTTEQNSRMKRVQETKPVTKSIKTAPTPATRPRTTRVATPAKKAGGLVRPTKPTKSVVFHAVTEHSTDGKHTIPKLARETRMDSINGPAHKVMGQLNKPKNLRVNDSQSAAVDSGAAKTLSRALDPKEILSPDAQRYTALLDNPFEAPWGDSGEKQVKPLLYSDITPPATTQTIRCYGQTSISIPAGSKYIVGFCVGNANQVDPYPASSVDVRGVAPLTLYNGGVANKACAFLGMPNCENGNFYGNNLSDGSLNTQAGGQGCAGYIVSYPVLSTGAPRTDLPSVSSLNDLLHWGNSPPVGDMQIGDATSFKYRPVAGGLMITPAAAVDTLGGTINISIIPQANNMDWTAPSASSHGTSTNIADFYGLPDHKITRGDKMVTVNWLPSRQDYDFLVPYGLPSDAAGTFTPVNYQNTTAGECRVFAEIIPADVPAGGYVNYVLTYVAFYEVSGYAVNATGTVPRPQPSLGAKCATAVQDNLFVENDNRSKQVQETTTLEVAKDHPKLGPIIEDCSTTKEAKSWFSEIIDLGKEIVPLAAMLL